MLEEEKIVNNVPAEVVEPSAEDEMLPAELDLLPLQKETTEVLSDIVQAKSVDELKGYVSMFNLNMAKKNAVRIAKLQNLLDSVSDNAADRFEKHPDEFSNKEILDYMKTVQDQIISSQQSLEKLDETPMIQINNQKNEVNINVGVELSRESKERVLNAVNSLIKNMSKDKDAQEDEKELYNNDDESDYDEDYDAVYEDDETNRDLDYTEEYEEGEDGEDD